MVDLQTAATEHDLRIATAGPTVQMPGNRLHQGYFPEYRLSTSSRDRRGNAVCSARPTFDAMRLSAVILRFDPLLGSLELRSELARRAAVRYQMG
ncbi:hypothetical protein LL06_08930 [Hoeflea sp. BAL378]|uniref:hypothetical protein n=1 Tax=Hoeflea sp. BAL378 TaxID=1547437 RepID=UPI000513BEF8|nr:hypothetical protein [Hoeflea sp. BAL378]KGF69799.1 hypothetical protein LL06_08930 [Hoeflea sp. BAL378]